MPTLWHSDLPLRRKLEGTFHLGANLAFPAGLFLTAITLPVMRLRMGSNLQKCIEFHMVFLEIDANEDGLISKLELDVDFDGRVTAWERRKQWGR